MKNHHLILINLLLLACAGERPSTEKSMMVFDTNEVGFLEVKHLPVQRTIPPVMLSSSGDSITSIDQWRTHREYIKEMLEFYQYGQMPPVPQALNVTENSKTEEADRIISDYDFTISHNDQSLTFRVGLVRPKAEGTYPVIVKNDRYRFDVMETENIKSREKYAKQKRGEVDQFVADEAIRRGYVYCKFIREDVAADINGPKEGRIFDLYPEYNWGAITAWAWTHQIINNWLEKQPWADVKKLVATGHSRGGKTALCAGIFDERIAVTVPNSSGIGGTGSLRFYDFTKGNIQTIEHQSRQFKHWWPDRLYTLKGHIHKVPFDTHFAKALIAPRALLNPHARQDFWANPYGTYLTYLAAQPVFDLYGVPENNAIHWRDGGHAQGEEDWLALFEYCDRYFYEKPTSRKFDENPYPGVYQFEDIDAHDVTKRKENE